MDGAAGRRGGDLHRSAGESGQRVSGLTRPEPEGNPALDPGRVPVRLAGQPGAGDRARWVWLQDGMPSEGLGSSLKVGRRWPLRAGEEGAGAGEVNPEFLRTERSLDLWARSARLLDLTGFGAPARQQRSSGARAGDCFLENMPGRLLGAL